MTPLPYISHKLVDDPGIDGYRWRVVLEEYGHLVVDVSDTQAKVAGLTVNELHARLPEALQRYAKERIHDSRDVLEHVGMWNVPVVLQAEHFRP